MIPITCFRNKKVAVFGLGASGVATAQALMEGGAFVDAYDDNEHCRSQAVTSAIPLIDLRKSNWEEYSALILAPGVPLTHPSPHWVVKLARASNVEIIGDIELFLRERAHFLEQNALDERCCPYIAITGTNGKSTTTALTAHLLRSSGRDTEMGGNIGTAILALAPFAPDRTYVIECSSFQIDLTPSLKPTIGCLLNITPDHIDRHGSFANYCRIKERLVESSTLALVAVDDKIGARIEKSLREQGHKVFAVATDKPCPNGYFNQDNVLYFADNGIKQRLADLSGVVALRGRHNAQNALMAIAVLRGLNTELDSNDLQHSLESFIGLAHRMQHVRKIGKTQFINDSKATNAEAAAQALATFERIYWICGGRAKDGGIDSLRPLFPKIACGYLIGEATSQFAATINGDFPIKKCDTLENAVTLAAADAFADPSGENTVLLSPACASYDQFPNYSARGEAFVRLVNELSTQSKV